MNYTSVQDQTTDKFHTHRVDHLFLLVGTNPLPNYVAARLLSRQQCRFYLLASQGAAGTSGVAGRLKERLISDGFDQSRFAVIEIDDPSDRYSIQNAIKNLDLFDNARYGVTSASRIGLHYTGGTKPMSVHAYEHLKEACIAHRQAFQYSYLDPRRLAFRFEGETIDLGPKDCPLSLEELLALHGWEKAPPKPHPSFETVARQVGKGINNANSLSGFRNSFLKRKADELIVLPSILGVDSMSALLKEHGLTDDADTHKAVFHYLSGGNWLEDYVAACIQDIAADCDVKFEGTNISPQRRGAGSRRGQTTEERGMFEFDVAAMRGYQLLAFSCGISSKRESLKNKLFEVYTRARQMGGEEARVALVCGFDDARGLLDEINEDWLEGRGVIKVFGPPDYPDLSRKLKKWFMQT